MTNPCHTESCEDTKFSELLAGTWSLQEWSFLPSRWFQIAESSSQFPAGEVRLSQKKIYQEQFHKVFLAIYFPVYFLLLLSQLLFWDGTIQPLSIHCGYKYATCHNVYCFSLEIIVHKKQKGLRIEVGWKKGSMCPHRDQNVEVKYDSILHL